MGLHSAATAMGHCSEICSDDFGHHNYLSSTAEEHSHFACFALSGLQANQNSEPSKSLYQDLFGALVCAPYIPQIIWACWESAGCWWAAHLK